MVVCGICGRYTYNHRCCVSDGAVKKSLRDEQDRVDCPESISEEGENDGNGD